jgi:hypothetical protein
VPAQVISQLQALDLDRMSPMQAWEALRTMQSLLAEKQPKNQI